MINSNLQKIWFPTCKKIWLFPTCKHKIMISNLKIWWWFSTYKKYDHLFPTCKILTGLSPLINKMRRRLLTTQFTHTYMQIICKSACIIIMQERRCLWKAFRLRWWDYYITKLSLYMTARWRCDLSLFPQIWYHAQLLIRTHHPRLMAS